jgi:hypothetical protein
MTTGFSPPSLRSLQKLLLLLQKLLLLLLLPLASAPAAVVFAWWKPEGPLPWKAVVASWG